MRNLKPAKSSVRSPRSARIPRSAATAILARELSAYFSSPVAYIVSGLFLVFSGMLFISTFFLVNRAELRDFFGLLPVLFSFFIPALTMRLFAEEKRSGTIETLFTLPVSALDAVLGKFLAALVFVAVMLLPTLAYVLTAAFLGDLDPGPVVGGYLGALLLAAGFSAVGVYASAVTKTRSWRSSSPFRSASSSRSWTGFSCSCPAPWWVSWSSSPLGTTSTRSPAASWIAGTSCTSRRSRCSSFG